MRKNIFYYLATLLLLTLVGCSSDANRIPEVEKGGDRTLSVNLTPAPELKAIIKDLNSRKIFLQWEEGFFDMNVVIKQGDVLELISGVKIQSAEGDACSFDIELPETINLDQTFDMYGIVSENVKVEDGKILVGVGGRVMYELTKDSSNKDGFVPVYFEKQGIEMYGDPVEADFKHLGALAVVTVLNKSAAPLNTAGFAVRPADGTTEFYHKAALPFTGNEELPYIDLLDMAAAPIMKMTRVVYPSVVIPENDVRTVGFWFCPNTDSTPAVKLAMYDADGRVAVLSEETRPERATAMQLGRAYHIYAEWDGAQLNLVSEEPLKPLPADQPVMKFTSNLQPGENFFMIVGGANPEAERDIWIDLNNNGTREMGEFIQKFSNRTVAESFQMVTLDSQEFAIYGEVTTMVIESAELTALDVTMNPHLDQFFTFGGNISKIDLSNAVKLRRVALDENQTSEIIFSPEATGLEEIYVANNNLTTLDVSMASNALLIEAGDNQLTSIKVPASFIDLWGFNVENNQLTADALNTIYDSLNQAGTQIYYDWQYTMNLWGNPGTATSDVYKLKLKGWTGYTEDPNAAPAAVRNQSAGAKSVSPLRAPLK